MDEKMIQRHQRRMQVFIEEGLSAREALDLADRMYDRDRDPSDDRRLCFECANYTVRKMCSKLIRGGKEQRPLRFVLQRCEWFMLRSKT